MRRITGGIGKRNQESREQGERIPILPRHTPLASLCLCLLLTVLLTVLTGANPARAMTISDKPREETWLPDGPVHTIVRTTDTVYLSGHFTCMGPYMGCGVPLDTTTGAPVATFPKVDGVIYACIADSRGGWFIGGDFTRVGNANRSRLAHIQAGGSLDPGWNPDVNNTIRTMALAEGMIYVGGAFTTINGQERSHLAALNTNTGTVTAWNPGANNTVYALAVSAGIIYAGGDFTSIGGQARNRIAAVDIQTGLVSTWDPNAWSWDPSPRGAVYALAISGSTVYAGGNFDLIGGAIHPYLAALDARTGLARDWNSNADTNWSQDVARGPSSGGIYALAISGSTIYAGGNFNVYCYSSRQSRYNLAAYDITTGAMTQWEPEIGSYIFTLAVSGNTVYAGGNFQYAGGQWRISLAALDGTTGAVTAWVAHAGGCVNALAISGGELYAGGDFSSIGGQPRTALAAMDAQTGVATAWDPGYRMGIDALAISGGTVYAGGDSWGIRGQEYYNLAALDSTTGLATAWDPHSNGSVLALAVSGSTVYTGGKFTQFLNGGQARSYLAAFDTNTGMATNWNPNISGKIVGPVWVYPGTFQIPDRCYSPFIQTLAISNGVVYAGGEFNKVGGQPRNNITALDAATGVPTTWDPNANDDVYALATSEGGTVYAGGWFTAIGGQSRNHLAALDSTTGLATAWNPNPNDDVSVLATLGNTVLVGGYFTTIGGKTRNCLAALDATTGVATDWNPNVDGHVVDALAVSNRAVYVGGDFLTIGGQRHPYFAQFDIIFDLSYATDGTPGATLSGTTTQTVRSGGNGTAVTALAPAGWHFVKWTNGGADYSTANPLLVSKVTADLALVAHFAPNQYTVTFQTNGVPGAALSGARRQTVTRGANAAAVKALAPAGYHFTKWTLNGRYYTIANPITLSRVTANMTLTAVCAINTYTVSFQTDGRPGATLAGLTKQTINYGASGATIKANAPAGYRFTKWTAGSRNYAYSNPLTVSKVAANLTLVANFTPIQYTVTFKTDGTRGATLSGSQTQTVNAGASATAVKAVAPKGYRFVRWTKGGASYSTANPLTVTKVGANLTLVANFKKK